MKREVIRIDESKCNGCGACIPNCHEGALQVIDGKARLISDLFCDGLGACIGHCPQGAISIENRESEPYNEAIVMENIIKGGPAVIAAHLKHLEDHRQGKFLAQAKNILKQKGITMNLNDHDAKHGKGGCGCPGSQARDFRGEDSKAGAAQEQAGPVASELRQWPIQLHLVNPQAPYFMNADLVVAADCVPFSYGDFHRRFLKGKALVIFCPKLDDAREQYIEKLAELIRYNNLKSISIVHMEVPCCAVESIITEALEKAGKNVVLKEYTISLRGEIV